MSVVNKIDPPVVEPDTVQPAPREGRGDHPTITADTARQGPRGQRVLYVLLVGMFGAAALMGIAWLLWASTGS